MYCFSPYKVTKCYQSNNDGQIPSFPSLFISLFFKPCDKLLYPNLLCQGNADKIWEVIQAAFIPNCPCHEREQAICCISVSSRRWPMSRRTRQSSCVVSSIWKTARFATCIYKEWPRSLAVCRNCWSWTASFRSCPWRRMSPCANSTDTPGSPIGL